jgi:proline iminopeptidase
MSSVQNTRTHSRGTWSREGFVDGAGAKLYYKALGRGPPLLALHGGPGADHTDFLPYLRPLSRRNQLILIDERGSGRSERLQDPKNYKLDYMVDDIECIRRSFGLKRMALLGHSFGGILAQAYAVRYPHRLTRLVLAGTAVSAKWFEADFRRIRSALAPSLRGKIAAFEKRGIFRADGQYRKRYVPLITSALAPYMYTRRLPSSHQGYFGVTGWEILREMWVRRSDFRVDGSLKGFNFASSLKTVDVPTLVVIGDRDLVTEESAQSLSASLPRSELVVLRSAGHMMFVDQTRRFNALVSNFLCSHRSRLKKR